MTVPERDDLQKAINACHPGDPREEGIREALTWAGGWTGCTADTFIEQQIETGRRPCTAATAASIEEMPHISLLDTISQFQRDLSAAHDRDRVHALITTYGQMCREAGYRGLQLPGGPPQPGPDPEPGPPAT